MIIPTCVVHTMISTYPSRMRIPTRVKTSRVNHIGHRAKVREENYKSLLQKSPTKETYNFKKPTNRSHPIAQR